jgi:hypothetical protein
LFLKIELSSERCSQSCLMTSLAIQLANSTFTTE